MSLDALKFPVAYHDGAAYFFEPTDRYSGTYFGGPCEAPVTGVGYGPEPLHHIMTVDDDDVPIISPPLLYGLRYSGCDLTYRISDDDECEILKMEPRKSSADFPYLRYPSLLPYIPMRMARRLKISR